MNDNNDFLEKTLEDILFETPNNYLSNRGLNINGIKRRQLIIGKYGKLDLLTCERIKEYDRLDLTIYELKKGIINEDTFFQAIRYARGLQRYLYKYRRNNSYKIDIVLIGNKINTNDNVSYLSELLNYSDDENTLSVKIYTYEYRFDGIYFTECNGYKLSEEGF